MKKVAITIGALLLAASGALYATPAEDLVASLDADGDSQISPEEAVANPEIEAQFTVLDANKDGYLTADELEPEPAPAPEEQPAG
jgi:hypothetical protein